jgi:8-oxo-dGTP pyrophosphatase MutT (NUDIX family)
MRADERVVRAAGGVPWRVLDDFVEVAVVHRPKYDDWTFPKGKLDAGETYRDAARREVFEETGLDVVPGEELVSVSYRDASGRKKTVRYWEMRVDGGDFTPNDEVDELRWVAVSGAGRLLTYRHDDELVASFARFARSLGFEP